MIFGNAPVRTLCQRSVCPGHPQSNLNTGNLGPRLRTFEDFQLLGMGRSQKSALLSLLARHCALVQGKSLSTQHHHILKKITALGELPHSGFVRKGHPAKSLGETDGHVKIPHSCSHLINAYSRAKVGSNQGVAYVTLTVRSVHPSWTLGELHCCLF